MMPWMPDFEAEIRRDLGHLVHHIIPVSQGGTHAAANLATQPPATVPATMAAATAAATAPQEDTMSLITDAEQGYAAVKAELGKFEAALPGALADAKKFEGSAFAQLAEKTASALLPPEAVAVAVKAAEGVIDDLIALYAPQQPAQPQQPVPAGQ